MKDTLTGLGLEWEVKTGTGYDGFRTRSGLGLEKDNLASHKFLWSHFCRQVLQHLEPTKG